MWYYTKGFILGFSQYYNAFMCCFALNFSSYIMLRFWNLKLFDDIIQQLAALRIIKVFFSLDTQNNPKVWGVCTQGFQHTELFRKIVNDPLWTQQKFSTTEKVTFFSKHSCHGFYLPGLLSKHEGVIDEEIQLLPAGN